MNDIPTHSVIKNILSNIKKHGSIQKFRSKTRIGQKSALKPGLGFPLMSIRKAASAVSVSPTLLYYIFHDYMHLKPYKFHLWHNMNDKDYEKRLNFAHCFIKLPKSTHEYIICSDEAYFYSTLPLSIQSNQ